MATAAHRPLAVVTGATSGIGLETARGLARAGMDLVLACRDDTAASEVRDRIVAESPGSRVEHGHLDLASLETIRAFATWFLARRHALDVLVDNAGVFRDRHRLTADGFEQTIGVNFLGTYLLTRLLLPALRRAGARSGSRIVIVSSAAAAYGRLRLGDDAFTRHPHGFPGYASSKLALVHLAVGLAEELRGSGVTANAVHPGDAATAIWRGEGPLMKLVGPIMRRRLPSAAEAALPVVRAAIDSGLRGVSGRFLGPRGELPPSRKYAHADARRVLLDLAARAVGTRSGTRSTSARSSRASR